MRVLVTGATGFIGRAVTRALIERGDEVRALARDPVRAARLPEGAELRIGDLAAPDSLAGVARGVDAVVHLGAAMRGDWETHRRTTVAGTRCLLGESIAAGVSRFVHVSSIMVYDRSRLASGETISEDAAHARPGPDIGALASAKVEAERLVVRAAGDARLPVRLLRPGIVVGDERSVFVELGAPLFGWRIALGEPAQPLPLIAIGSLVDAMLATLDGPAGPQRCYNVVDDFRASRAEYLQLLGEIRGRPQPSIHVPLLPAVSLIRVVRGLRALPGLGWLPETTASKLRGRTHVLHYSTSALQRDTAWRPGRRLRDAFSSSAAERDASSA